MRNLRNLRNLDGRVQPSGVTFRVAAGPVGPIGTVSRGKEKFGRANFSFEAVPCSRVGATVLFAREGFVFWLG